MTGEDLSLRVLGCAGGYAETGRARHLVLAHLPPGADRAKARALASERFGGEVDLAAQGSVFAIGPVGVSRVTECG